MNKDRTILIADDELYVRELISMILKKEGYQVIEAVNGKDALEKLRTNKIEMVVTDIRMPEMDGIEFTKKLRNISAYSQIPVLMVSSEFYESRKMESILAGVNDWIMKPLITKDLLQVLKDLEHKEYLAQI
ncbi:MAG: response regulator [Nitrospirota bacterium]